MIEQISIIQIIYKVLTFESETNLFKCLPIVCSLDKMNNITVYLCGQSRCILKYFRQNSCGLFQQNSELWIFHKTYTVKKNRFVENICHGENKPYPKSKR